MSGGRDDVETKFDDQDEEVCESDRCGEVVEGVGSDEGGESRLGEAHCAREH